jgi:hypothetical protein
MYLKIFKVLVQESRDNFMASPEACIFSKQSWGFDTFDLCRTILIEDWIPRSICLPWMPN